MAYNKTKRNFLGMGLWFLAGLVISILALIPMVAREKKQAELGNFPLEWDDIAFYSFAVLMGSGIQLALIQWVCGM